LNKFHPLKSLVDRLRKDVLIGRPFYWKGMGPTKDRDTHIRFYWNRDTQKLKITNELRRY